MKRFLCLAFAIMLCMNAAAFADTSTTITEVPTPNNGNSIFPPAVDFPLNIDFTNVKEHEFNYDVTIDFSDAAFAYSYEGEFKVNPNNGAADYSGIEGSWTDKEAKIVITCNDTSDLVKVWVRDASVASHSTFEITSDNPTSEDTPRELIANQSLEITYTADGEIPFNDTSWSPIGPNIYPLGRFKDGETTMKVLLYSVSVYITDEFGSGMDLWDN